MTNASYQVHTLAAGEQSQLQRLLDLFGQVFEEPHVYCSNRPTPDYLGRLLEGRVFLAVVALEGGEVIGGLTAYEMPKPEQARSEIYIYDLAVAEAHRRKGVATALIGEVRRIAAERGAWVVFVQADQGDEAPIALYSKLGKREDILHFDIAPATGYRPPNR